ncbi:hypothetical protein DFH09DRAFT_1155022 [Mycena vulgaris]|nr:hypothetical protein DFH09DRAFT_1155022 [Mycena vulgaris]
MTDVGSEEEEEEEPPVEENHGEEVSTPNSNSNSNPPCDYEMGEGELGEEKVLPPPKVPVDETTILSAVIPLEGIPAVCYFWSKYCKSTKSTSATGSLDREPKLPLKVRERDRNNCVFHASLSEQVSHLSLHACHFIPHAKGDDYVKRLVRNHEVPLEDQMRVVDTPLNAVCMKDTWHKYVTRAVAAILLVPNRFLSKEDIKFKPKARFSEPYSDVLRPEEESDDGGKPEPPSKRPRLFGGEEECQPPSSSKQASPTPVRASSQRVRDNSEKATADARRKQEEEAAAEAAERDTGRGHPKSEKPPEEPFNHDSQLVLQYFVTGPEGVGDGDVRSVPHNTPALLREGTRLSVSALHAAYTCAVWKTFSPCTTDPLFIPSLPCIDYYGLQPSHTRSQHRPSGASGGESGGDGSS